VLSTGRPTRDPVEAHRPLRLPKTADEWVEADELLHAQVVPAVLNSTSVEEKTTFSVV